MGNSVFANMMEISSKSMAGKSICQFPDVCFTPPLTPATPPGVPIPYPNTGMASDTTDGSSSVMIGGEQVMLKDRSAFKQSTGDEAGAAPKKGLLNSKTKGKVYFIAWSMDVKIEGENVVRNLDMTTHNAACKPVNGAVPTVHVAMMSPGWNAKNCSGEIKREQKACSEFDPYEKGKSVCAAAGMTKGVRSFSESQHLAHAQAIQTAPGPPAKGKADNRTKREKAMACLRARRCHLVPYSPKDPKGTKGCCPSQTPDHLMPKASFKDLQGGKLPGWKKGYRASKAPCICAEGPSNHGKGSHPLRHAYHKGIPPKGVAAGDMMPYPDAVDHSAEGGSKVFKASGCSKKCIKGQLDTQHKQMADNKKKPSDVKYTPSGSDVPTPEINQRVTQLNIGGR
jgi:hypothetical protein